MPAKQSLIHSSSRSASLSHANEEADVDNEYVEDQMDSDHDHRMPLLFKSPQAHAIEIGPAKCTRNEILSPFCGDNDANVSRWGESDQVQILRVIVRRKAVRALPFLLFLGCVFLLCYWCIMWLLTPELQWRNFQTEFDLSIATSGLLVSKATYCEPETVWNWTCEVCLEHLPGFRLYNVYENKTSNTLGLSGVLPEESLIVVAFRGTRNVENWIHNLKFFMRPYIVLGNRSHKGSENPKDNDEEEVDAKGKNECEDCAVHTGFYETFESIQPQVRVDVAYLREAYPHYMVLITGHSLGAAIALLSALDFLTFPTSSISYSPPVIPTGKKTPHKKMDREIGKEEKDNDVEDRAAGSTTTPHSSLSFRELLITPIHPNRLLLYTFGSPRVGNVNFSQWANQKLSSSFRLTHHRDVIPHVPPASLGYRHVPHEIFFSNESNLLEFHHCADRNRNTSLAGLRPDISHRPTAAFFGKKLYANESEMDGEEDPSCSSGVWGTTFSDHKLYLGMTTGCVAANLTSGVAINISSLKQYVEK